MVARHESVEMFDGEVDLTNVEEVKSLNINLFAGELECGIEVVGGELNLEGTLDKFFIFEDDWFKGLVFTDFLKVLTDGVEGKVQRAPSIRRGIFGVVLGYAIVCHLEDLVGEAVEVEQLESLVNCRAEIQCGGALWAAFENGVEKELAWAG